MYVKLNGEKVYLWRAVDKEGEILESFVKNTRDKPAALKFMKKALKRHCSPETITTDDPSSYAQQRARRKRSVILAPLVSPSAADHASGI